MTIHFDDELREAVDLSSPPRSTGAEGHQLLPSTARSQQVHAHDPEAQAAA